VVRVGGGCGVGGVGAADGVGVVGVVGIGVVGVVGGGSVSGVVSVVGVVGFVGGVGVVGRVVGVGIVCVRVVVVVVAVGQSNWDSIGPSGDRKAWMDTRCRFQCISWKVELVKNQVLWHQLQTIHVEFPCPGSCSQTKNTYLRSREILYAFAALPFLFATLIIPWDI